MQAMSEAMVAGTLEALAAKPEFQRNEGGRQPEPSHDGNRQQRRAAAAIERKEAKATV